MPSNTEKCKVNCPQQTGLQPQHPIAIAYEPQQYGGIELQDLYVEQCILHTMFLIQHIWAKSETASILLTTIEAYQWISGLSGTALTNTTPIDYLDTPWLKTTRLFMHQPKTKLHVKALTPIHSSQNNNIVIMEAAIRETHSVREHCLINTCRLWLQVTFVSDITNTGGQTLLSAAIYGTETNGVTNLWNHSQSKYMWHSPQRLSFSVWQAWKLFLSKLCYSPKN